MSADPQAILYYGVRLPDKHCDSHDDDSGEYAYNAWNETWEKEHRPPQPDDRSDYKSPAWDAWREVYHQWKATPDYVDVDFGGDGDNCKSYFVHCPCLRIKVEWDEQHDFGRDHLLSVHPVADQKIKEFCEQFGLPFERPSWHLAARYF